MKKILKPVIGAMALLGIAGVLASCGNQSSTDTSKDNTVVTTTVDAHTWNNPVYVWNADNTKCEATRACIDDPSHTETETVNVTYEEITAPTADKVGEGQYSAVFKNSAFGTQIKKNVIPALGYVYDYDSIDWQWSADSKTAKVTIPCKVAAGATPTTMTNTPYVEENIETVEIEKVNPTCSQKGSATYKAEIVVNGVKYFDENTIELATIDHDLVDDVTVIPTLEKDGELSHRCRICNNVISTEKINKLTDQTNYSLNATLMANTPGVYSVKAGLGSTEIDATSKKPTTTIGIPSIAKQNLANYPTLESPAIVQGAQYGYETKTPGKVEYKQIEGAVSKSPYNKFPHKVIEETLTDADGKTSTHLKLSGFDGSYYIIRIDVSDVISGKTGFLHIKEESNKALMVIVGVQASANSVSTNVAATTDATTGAYLNKPVAKEDGYWYIGETKTEFTTADNKSPFVDFWGNWSFNPSGFVDNLGNKTYVYSLADNAIALKDDKNAANTPYVDVIVMSSGKLVAGADTGSANAISSDISLSMYVDDIEDYNPELEYDPTAQAPAQGSTEPSHSDKMLAKYFDASKLTNENGSSYLIKGSDLEIDVATFDNEVNANDISKYWDPKKEYWSLTNAIAYQQYNNHIIKLICEVPVLEALEVKGTADNKRTIIFDVNSFDIQIANHNTTGAAALRVLDNATLKLTDSTRTSGAELAVGNNANLEVDAGGTLIVDEPCQLEVEYDAATITQTTEGQTPTTYENGVIRIKNGGRLINYGVINVEGVEFKPIQNNTQEQGQGQQTITDQKASALYVAFGGTIDNYGCISLKGNLYIMGTLNNYGKYKDTINATDPDKGTIQYHRGIQVTWKDDVTSGQTADASGKYPVNSQATPGKLIIGADADNRVFMESVVNNYGDIVLVPGTIELHSTLNNLTDNDSLYTGHVYVCDVTEVVIPITPSQTAPTITEERRQLSTPYQSTFDKKEGAAFNGTTTKATVKPLSNGFLGDLTPLAE